MKEPNTIRKIIRRISVWIDKTVDHHPYTTIFLIALYTYFLYVQGEILQASIYIALVILLVTIFFVFRKMDNELERIWRITLVLIVMYTLLAFIASIVARFLVPKVFYIGSIDAWIGFSGSILGGSLTMLALMFTIDHEKSIRNDEKSQRNYELAIQSIPLLHVVVNQTDCDKFSNNFVHRPDTSISEITDVILFPFTIINKSTFFATEVVFKSFNAYTADPFLMGFEDQEKVLIADLCSEANEKISSINTLPGGYSENFTLGVKYNNIHSKFIVFNLAFEYFDYAGTISHSVESNIELNLVVKKIDREEINLVETKVKIEVDNVQNRFIK